MTDAFSEKPGKVPAVFSNLWKNFWPGLALFVLTVAVFWPATACDFIDLDDSGYVYQNPQVTRGLTRESARWALTTVHESWWLPLLWLSFMLDTELHGPEPFGYHLTNILLHAANAALLFWVLFRLTRARGRSALVAALFALHPLRVESVAWITERKDVLSGFFWMLAVWAYLRYVEQPSWRRRFWTALWMLLGLLSKAILVALPPVLLLLDYWPLRRAGNPWRRDQWPAWGRLVREKLALLALSLVFIVINLKTHVAGSGLESGLSLGHRLSLIPANYWAYLAKIFWPLRLGVMYPENDDFNGPLCFWSLLGLVLLTLALLRLAVRRPFLVVGWFWFLVVLFPVIRGVRLGLAQFADRFVYLPSIGLALMLVWAVADWAERGRRRLIAVLVAVLGLLTGMGWATVRQIGYWQNSETLFAHTLKVTKDNPIIGNNLAAVYLDQRRFDESLPLLREVIRIAPTYPLPHHNLGCTLFGLGQREQALEAFRGALRLDPLYVPTHIIYGKALCALGRYEEGMAAFQNALKLDPHSALAHYNRANALYEMGRMEEALAAYRKALQNAPNDPDALFGVGNALYRLGRLKEAETHYRAVLSRRPDHFNAHNNLGNVLWDFGRPEEALEHYRQAARLAPTNATAQLNLGNLLVDLSRYGDALEPYRAAARLDPQDPRAFINLGGVLFRLGRYEESLDPYRTALQLAPTNKKALASLGSALGALGRPREALEYFQAAVDQDPNYFEAYLNWGNALNDLGQREEAATLLERALRLAQEQDQREWAAKLEARLREVRPSP